ncbi:MAG: ABC transporter ATP-binding protein [Synergistaceae bacterium]|nr:ABC transporter ATP-binding protein [Synergistaceae bacterium]
MKNSEGKKGNILDVRDLVIHYELEESTVRAVEGMSFTLGYGETLAFVGETGAGKTTTALGLMRLVPSPPGRMVGGEIFFEGRDIMKASGEELRAIRGEKISFISQDPMTSLNPVMSVGSQIAEMVVLHSGLSMRESRARAEEMLSLVGIRKERMGDYPHQFSGGMRQRVLIAIALACSPALLIADEPTSALDVTIQAQVLNLMKGLKERFDTSMIMITHDLGIAAETCDRVAIIYAGRIVEMADTESLFTEALHPYAIGLFNSIPRIDDDRDLLDALPGLMPDPARLPQGCPFHPRCAHASQECENSAPGLEDVGNGHLLACWLRGKRNSEVGSVAQ